MTKQTSEAKEQASGLLFVHSPCHVWIFKIPESCRSNLDIL